MSGTVPWTILRATQFFEFPEMIIRWTTPHGAATIPPLLMQPIASTDVARALIDVALTVPAGRILEAAGPNTEDLVDMARRALDAKDDTTTRLIPSWNDGPFGLEMAGDALLPGTHVRIAPTTFTDWLRRSTA
jgi:hypothetical protein